MAYIRAPEPAPYLRYTSDNDHNQSTSNNSPTSTESDQPTVPLRKSRRNKISYLNIQWRNSFICFPGHFSLRFFYICFYFISNNFQFEEAVGQGRKLQANHSGPYTVNEIQSPYLIKLRDPEGKRKFRI
jgi:hypothetical protein